MKCDSTFKQVRILNNSDGQVEQVEGRGRGFKDEREYLAFILEQERAWEIDNLWCGNDKSGDIEIK